MKTTNLVFSAFMGLLLSNATANDCSTIDTYRDGTQYATGATAQINNHVYECKEGGWCSQGGAYAPTSGWAWGYAWKDLGECSVVAVSSSQLLSSSTTPLSSSEALSSSIAPLSSSEALSSSIAPLSSSETPSSSVAPLSSSEAPSSSVAPLSSSIALSSSVAPMSSSTVSNACDGIQTWNASTIYASGGTQVQHNNKKYKNNWYSQNHNPSEHSDPYEVWTYLEDCSIVATSSAALSSSTILVSSSLQLSSSIAPSSSTPLSSSQALSSSGQSSSSSTLEWTSVDLGNVGATGSAVQDQGQVTLLGSGWDIEGNEDHFHYYYQPVSGDVQFTVRVNSVENIDQWTKSGLMIRDEIDSKAKNAFVFYRPEFGAGYQWRAESQGGTSNFQRNHISPSNYLRLVRQGNTYSSYFSQDSLCWSKVGVSEFETSGEDYIGFALTSHQHGTLAESNFSEVSIENTVEEFNSNCARAQTEGQIAVPQNWIVEPGVVSPQAWKYTFDSPNPSNEIRSCHNNQIISAANNNLDHTYRDGLDDPQCIDYDYSPSWAQASFNDWNWSTGNSGFGSTDFYYNEHFEKNNTQTNWPTNESDIWLRKKVNLTAEQIDDLIFYGRWGNAQIVIYVNGVMATADKNSTPYYEHLGLNHAARAALVVGENTIAVRLRYGSYKSRAETHERYFDMGITTNSKLAQLPISEGGVDGSAEYQPFLDIAQEQMIQHGMAGGVLTIMKDDQVQLSKGLGYTSKYLDEAMPYNAPLRLASNDKAITIGLVQKLFEEGLLPNGFETKVFPLFFGLTPPPGMSPGNRVKDITVWDLLTHESGIGDIADYQIYDAFGITADEWNKEYLLRYLYGQNTVFEPGSQNRYSSNGYFVLRYLVEYLTQKSIKQNLDEIMAPTGNNEIYLSYERLDGRLPLEPNYIHSEPISDRWVGLEDYLALSSTAEGFTRYLQAHKQSTGARLIDEMGHRTATPDGDGGGGAMIGTISLTMQHGDFALALIMNHSRSIPDVGTFFWDQLRSYTDFGGAWYKDYQVKQYKSDANEGGVISPWGRQLSNTNTQSYTFTPDAGYKIQNVIVNGNSVGTPSSYQFVNAGHSNEIKVIFVRE